VAAEIPGQKTSKAGVTTTSRPGLCQSESENTATSGGSKADRVQGDTPLRQEKKGVVWEPTVPWLLAIKRDKKTRASPKKRGRDTPRVEVARKKFTKIDGDGQLPNREGEDARRIKKRACGGKKERI